METSNLELQLALEEVRQAVKDGHIQDSSFKTITQAIFSDILIPSIGNKRAYLDFMSKNHDGTHIHIDGTAFGQINKKWGFDVGDEVIVALGEVIRSTLDKTVGKERSKCFRIGGDEFNVFVKECDVFSLKKLFSYSMACYFINTLYYKLKSLPEINGLIKIKIDVGIGNSSDNAEKALIRIKNERKSKNLLDELCVHCVGIEF